MNAMEESDLLNRIQRRFADVDPVDWIGVLPPFDYEAAREVLAAFAARQVRCTPAEFETAMAANFHSTRMSPEEQARGLAHVEQLRAQIAGRNQ